MVIIVGLNQFSRTELLIGKEGIEKLNNAKVAIFGLGGVGSFVVEGLVRAGVQNFILVDDDKSRRRGRPFASGGAGCRWQRRSREASGAWHRDSSVSLLSLRSWRMRRGAMLRRRGQREGAVWRSCHAPCRGGPPGGITSRTQGDVTARHGRAHALSPPAMPPSLRGSHGPACTTRPASSCSRCVVSGMMSASWCVTSTRCTPCRVSAPRVCSRAWRFASSRPEHGSSSRSSTGEPVRARARNTRRACPVERLRMCLPARCVMPRMSIQYMALSCSSGEGCS